jgi:metal-responsive CopG/Arc/MetJ family transcriptional regulator
MPMKKIMVSLPDEMVVVLEKDRKERYLETIPETIRVILSEYIRTKMQSNNNNKGFDEVIMKKIVPLTEKERHRFIVVDDAVGGG